MILSNKSIRGFSTLAALLTLLSLLAMGGVVAFLVASGEYSRTNHLTATQAFYVTQAGIEYALNDVYQNGGTGEVASPGIDFGPGNFSSTKSGITVTVTGTVGDAVRSYSVDAPNESNCLDIDTQSATLVSADKRITNVLLKKVCLSSITIASMTLTWSSQGAEAKLNLIRIENSNIYSDASGVSSGTEVNVTDYTIDNGATHTITKIEFTNKIVKNTAADVTITFTMSDGSTANATLDL